jgi:tRNA threonylcarbamoyladenosine biosynthesis protein TsaE
MSDSNNDETFTTQWRDLDACKHFAASFASVIAEPCCVALVGTLGAGKTQFVRYFVEAMGGDPNQVSSPTFVLLNMYHAALPIAHLDLYRLDRPTELDSIGFDDIVYGESVCLIEWADKFKAQMPDETLWIEIKDNGNARAVTLRTRHDSPMLGPMHRLSELTGSEH